MKKINLKIRSGVKAGGRRGTPTPLYGIMPMMPLYGIKPAAPVSTREQAE